MEEVGNEKAREKWEANVPKDAYMPDENDSVTTVERWIRDKYERRKYVQDKKKKEKKKKDKKKKGKSSSSSSSTSNTTWDDDDDDDNTFDDADFNVAPKKEKKVKKEKKKKKKKKASSDAHEDDLLGFSAVPAEPQAAKTGNSGTAVDDSDWFGTSSSAQDLGVKGGSQGQQQQQARPQETMSHDDKSGAIMSLFAQMPQQGAYGQNQNQMQMYGQQQNSMYAQQQNMFAQQQNMFAQQLNQPQQNQQQQLHEQFAQMQMQP
jgi:hypothetical protein